MIQSIRPISLIPSSEPALRFARRILQKIEPPVTHLKLQKLIFYAYGAALADGSDSEIGQVDFEAWLHGPVCRPVYDCYKEYGAQSLPIPELDEGPYPEHVEQSLQDVIDVYGRLSAWQLREQTHLEQPWITFSEADDRAIPVQTLREHFEKKFRAGQVTLPELMTQAWPLSFDGLPQARFQSLHELARAIGR